MAHQIIPMSLSAYLLHTTCEMRNPEITEKRGESGRTTRVIGEDSCIVTFAKRFTAEFCFVGIALLALVETVIRAFFTIPAYFLTLCMDREAGAGKFIWEATWIGTRFSLYTAIAAGAALVENLHRQTIRPLVDEDLAESVGDCLLK